MNLENLESSFLIRHGKGENKIKSACPHQGRIKEVFAVGGSQNDDLREVTELIELVKELTGHTLRGAHLASGASSRHQGIDLIEKQDARGGLFSPFEDLMQGFF